MITTYKYRLYPTKQQKQILECILEICRLYYNSALTDRRNYYQRTNKGLGRIDQQKILTIDRKRYSDIKQIYCEVLRDVLFRVDRAFTAFFRRAKEKNGPAGYPRFKSKNRYNSITYPKYGFKISGNNLKLSKIGTIRIKLHRPIRGTMKTCTIRRDIDRWYVCFSVEYEPVRIANRANKGAIGIDVGLKSFAVLSNGEVIDNPKYLKRLEDRLTQKQRQLSKKHKGSNNRNKARVVLAKVHRRIKEQRKDFHHKLSRRLIDEFSYVAVEDLNIKGMVKNHYLAKSILDAGWGQFITFLFYKAEEAGGIVEKIPRFYPSSKTCCVCGHINHELTLSQRKWTCPMCRTVHDRDENASKNILTVGTTENHAWGGETIVAPVNQEALSFMAG